MASFYNTISPSSAKGSRLRRQTLRTGLTFAGMRSKHHLSARPSAKFSPVRRIPKLPVVGSGYSGALCTLIAWSFIVGIVGIVIALFVAVLVGMVTWRLFVIARPYLVRGAAVLASSIRTRSTNMALSIWIPVRTLAGSWMCPVHRVAVPLVAGKVACDKCEMSVTVDNSGPVVQAIPPLKLPRKPRTRKVAPMTHAEYVAKMAALGFTVS